MKSATDSKQQAVGGKILKALLSLLLIIILAASCTTASDKSSQANSKFDTLPLPVDSTVFYFKTKANWQNTTRDALDTFVNSWYSYMLFTLKEPILKDYKGEKEVYRFTWLRSFNHPVIIRLEKQGDVIELFGKVSDGAGGYKPGKVIYDTTLHLTDEQVNAINLKLNSANFWTLQTKTEMKMAWMARSG